MAFGRSESASLTLRARSSPEDANANLSSRSLPGNVCRRLQAIQVRIVKGHPIHLDPARVPPNPPPLPLRLLPDDGEEGKGRESQSYFHRKCLLFDELLPSSFLGPSRTFKSLEMRKLGECDEVLLLRRCGINQR